VSRHDLCETRLRFIFGTWNVHNRKLVDVTDASCEEWVEFDALSHVAPILGGIGHTDQMSVTDPSDGGDPFDGFTLRLFDPESGTWRIWWSSSRNPGVLDTPVHGRFDGRHGVFECSDEIGGRTAHVRFEWFADDPKRPRWEQSFSYDGGLNWRRNWVMTFTRTDAA